MRKLIHYKKTNNNVSILINYWMKIKLQIKMILVFIFIIK